MAKDKSPAFQFYPRDFWDDINVAAMVAHGWDVVGMYFRLLSWCWLEGGVPADPEQLRTLLHQAPDGWAMAWPLLEPCFTISSDGKLTNPRIEKERSALENFKRSCVSRGKDGAKARWQKHSPAIARLKLANSKTIANDGSSSSSSNINPLTPFEVQNTQGWDVEKAFDELWAAYPAKGRTRRPMSQQYFVDKIRTPETFTRVIAAVKGKWAHSDKWAKGFIMALPQWIDQECWNEDPEPAGGIAFVGSSLQSTLDPETARRLAPQSWRSESIEDMA